MFCFPYIARRFWNYKLVSRFFSHSLFFFSLAFPFQFSAIGSLIFLSCFLTPWTLKQYSSISFLHPLSLSATASFAHIVPFQITRNFLVVKSLQQVNEWSKMKMVWELMMLRDEEEEGKKHFVFSDTFHLKNIIAWISIKLFFNKLHTQLCEKN